MSRRERRHHAARRDEVFLATLRAEHDTLARIALSRLRNVDDANDVLASTVAKVYERWCQGDIEDLGHYLATATKNNAVTVLRRRVRDAKVATLLAAQPTSGEGEFDAVTALPAEFVRSKLAQLDPDCREILTMCYVDGRSVEDVARELVIARGTVKSRCSRCKKKLEQLLETSDE